MSNKKFLQNENQVCVGGLDSSFILFMFFFLIDLAPALGAVPRLSLGPALAEPITPRRGHCPMGTQWTPAMEGTAFWGGNRGKPLDLLVPLGTAAQPATAP